MNTKKIIKQALIVLVLMVGAITLLSVIPVASAALIDPVKDVPTDLPHEGNLRTLALKIVNYFLTFLGIVAVMMVIFGGVTYVTAAGKQESIDNAKKIILYAIVGIVIILLSFAIINTVLGAVTGSEPTV